jgi:hypothetical protein
MQDLRLAVRSLRGHVVVTASRPVLALGMARTPRSSRLVDSLILRTLPIAEAAASGDSLRPPRQRVRPAFSYATFDRSAGTDRPSTARSLQQPRRQESDDHRRRIGARR